jgi:membrane protein
MIPASTEAGSLIGLFWSLFLLGAGLLIAVLVFALIFKYIPHRRVFWREAFSGAVVFIVVWEIGSIIFARLLPYFDYKRIYGRTGAVIALLVWVYTSNLILLFGANFTAQLHSMRMQTTMPRAGTFPGEKLRRLPSNR